MRSLGDPVDDPVDTQGNLASESFQVTRESCVQERTEGLLPSEEGLWWILGLGDTYYVDP